MHNFNESVTCLNVKITDPYVSNYNTKVDCSPGSLKIPHSKQCLAFPLSIPTTLQRNLEAHQFSLMNSVTGVTTLESLAVFSLAHRAQHVHLQVMFRPRCGKRLAQHPHNGCG